MYCSKIEAAVRSVAAGAKRRIAQVEQRVADGTTSNSAALHKRTRPAIAAARPHEAGRRQAVLVSPGPLGRCNSGICAGPGLERHDMVEVR